MPETYEPDRQFVEKLEWQLASEFRRSRRLRSAGKIAVPRQAIVLTVVAGVLLSGVAVTKAADLIKDSWRRKIELAKAETEVRLQKAAAEFKTGQAAKAEERASMGLITLEDSRAAKLIADRSALGLKKSELNLDEVRASGEPPRDDLSAPLVDGRDYVAERLEIDKRVLELSLDLRQGRIDRRFRTLAQLGLVGRSQMDDVLAATEAERAEVESLRSRIDIRKQFIEGRLSAKDVEIGDRLAIAERDERRARSRVDSLRKDLEDQRQLLAVGQVPEAVVQALQLGLNTAEEELALAGLEIEILKDIK
jgi:hypothetical protein